MDPDRPDSGSAGDSAPPSAAVEDAPAAEKESAPGPPRGLERDLRRRLLEQVHIGEPASRHSEEELVGRVDELVAATEEYWAGTPSRQAAAGRPFTDSRLLPEQLFNLGILLHGLRIGPGDVVGELGAGTCWVSHFLNLAGCRTISVDVSPTALDIGQELFHGSNRTRWELEPRFEAFDGRRLPLEDGACDRWIVYGAFHHVPNQREILSELARTLRPGSIVAMVEPGRYHSGFPVDDREKNLLRNDLVVEDLARLARECGFTRTTVRPLTLRATREVDAEDFRLFLRGEGLLDHWIAELHGLLEQHHVFLYNGDFIGSSRHRDGLGARIEILEPGVDEPLRVPAGGRTEVRCRLENTGSSRWIGEGDGPGTVFLGAHLLPEEGEAIWDWSRLPLRRDVEPGESLELGLDVGIPERAGRYRLEIDLVSEQVAWFAELGSPAPLVELVVA
ncbi:MAG: class I SAM-dependent methyltransferase [Thermoanaerobaculia bacterium]|nr:class I SAM-dependent methyltransferase [Thermoanaerobaculia bacterium]